MIKCPLIASAIIFALSATANAQTINTASASGSTVTNWYKQSVYDPKDAKIGSVDDVLLDKAGKVTGLVLGVGGFLGAGEKDVIIPFDAVKVTTKDKNKWYLVMNATKDQLQKAQGFKYDSDTTTWKVDKK